MLRRVSAAVLCLLGAQVTWGLDASSQKLADRYAAILGVNPTQDAAFERLWKIYEAGGETAVLVEQARKGAGAQPILAARILQRASFEAEARKILAPVAEKDAAAAELLASWLEKSGQGDQAAELLSKTGRQISEAGLLLKAAEIWVRAGQMGKAQTMWEQAAAIAPHDLAIQTKLARAAALAGNTAAACARWEVVADEGSIEEQLAAREEISALREKAGQLDEAIAAQTAVVAMLGPGHWKNESAQTRLYHLYERANRLPDWEALLLQAAAERPADGEAARRLASFYQSRGDESRRLEWLRKSVALRPASLATLREAADAELSTGNPEGAAALTDQILQQAPGDLDAIFFRAELAALRGDEKGAESRIAALLAKSPGDEGLRSRAREFYRKQRLTGSLEAQLKADRAKAPGDVGAALALAEFYMEEKRFGEAGQALDQLDLSQMKPAEVAMAARRIASYLHEAKSNEAALKWTTKALAAEPAALETAIEGAQILRALQRGGETPAMLEKAGLASVGSLPEEETDRRFHSALKAIQADDDLFAAKTGLPAVKKVVAALQARAVATKAEADWLRLGRWREWEGDSIAAEESLRAGLKDHPESVPLTESLADHFSSAGDFDRAIEELGKLSRLSPERSVEVQRKIGRLEINRGRTEEAQRIFEEIHKAHANDWQAAADLATAQQAAENWFPAMDYWLEAYRLAPRDAQRGLRPSILAVASRLQLYDRVLEFLEEAAGSENDTTARADIFREAAIYAVEQHIESAWRERLERRIAKPQEDPTWKVGLAMLLKEEGREEEAQALARGEAGPASLPALELALKAAEQAGQIDNAVRISQQIVRADKRTDSVYRLKYVGLLERSGKAAQAEATLETYAVAFARDREILIAAGDFFAKRGEEEKAERYYRQAVALGATPTQVLLRLGRMAIARRDRDQAVKDFEILLATSRPEGNAFLVPVPAGLEARAADDSWKAPEESTTQGGRLLAIKELGQFLKNSPNRQKWAEGFSEPGERVWAEYYSGNVGRALEETEGRVEKSGVPFAALAIESGEAQRVARWASADPSHAVQRWTWVEQAVSVLLDRGWKPSATSLQGLVGNAPATRRWNIARSLANHGHLRLALEVGGSVPPALPDAMAAQAWLEYSNWCLALRDTERARQSLDRAAAITPAAASFTEPSFAAIRARWLLTPPEKRATYEQELKNRFSTWKEKPAQEAGLALVASLRGENELAAQHMGGIFSNTDLAAPAVWTEDVQQSGRMLEQWRLPRLARELYRQYLAENEASLKLQGENFREETEAALVINKLLEAKGNAPAYLTATWIARRPGQEQLLQAVRRLNAAREFGKANEVLASLCQQAPESDSIVGGVLTFSQERFYLPILHGYVGRILKKSGSALARVMINSAGGRLASIYQGEGAHEEALKLLTSLDTTSATVPFIQLQRAQLLAKLGRHREAISVLEQQPSRETSANALLLADLYGSLGREREAIGVLQRQMQINDPNRLVAAAKLKELAETVGDMPAAAKASAVLTQSTSSQAPADWPGRIESLNQKFTSPKERFQAGSQFLLSNPDVPADLREREAALLNKLAKADPSLVPANYRLRKALALKDNQSAELEKEMQAEWAGGKGNYFAGEILIQLYLEQKRTAELARLLDEYLTDEHFRGMVWRQIAASLLAMKENTLAERVLKALRSRSDGDAALDLMLAEALWKQGRSPSPLTEPIEEIAVIDPARSLDLARYFLAIDMRTEARDCLLRIPPDSSSGNLAGETWAQLLTQQIERGDLTAARESLGHLARKYPEHIRGAVVADYWTAAGQLGTLPPSDRSLALTDRAKRDWQMEMVERLARQNNSDRAFQWMEANRSLLEDARGRTALQGLEAIDPGRAMKIWDAATAQGNLWEIRTAAAQAQLRQARRVAAAGQSPLKGLEAALKLDPGSLAVVEASVAEYQRRGQTKRAVQILEAGLKAYGTPGDHQAMRKLLEALKTSPSLPRSPS